MKFTQIILAAAVMIGSLNVAVSASDSELHGIEIFECDQHLQELSHGNRQIKNQGTPVRVCFRPYESSVSRIKSIDSFTWETAHKRGNAEQEVVSNGHDNGATSLLACKDEGKLCYLDSYLGSDFYLNSGSVEGFGAATLEIRSGDHESLRTVNIPLQKWLFQAEFNLVMKNGPDGEELSIEESQAMKDRLAKQYQAEMAATAAQMRSTSTAEL